MIENIKRATGLLIIEVVNSNPNGDPDRESDPRQRPNGLGEISPVSFKRKLRDLVENTDGPVFKAICDKLKLDKNNFNILESRGRDRQAIIKEMGEDHPPRWWERIGLNLEQPQHDLLAWIASVRAKKAEGSLGRKEKKVKELERKAKELADKSWFGALMSPIKYSARTSWYRKARARPRPWWPA